MSKTIIATYEDVHGANRAVERLFEEGFTNEEISMLLSDATKDKHLAIETNTKAPEGVATGAAVGGTLGAIAAGLTAVASIVIPGLGLVVAGPLLAALAGLGAGGAVGGLVGGLVGLGISENEAKVVEEAIKNGNVVIAVSHDDRDRIKVARAVFESTSALNTAAA
ncbi:hypothetical protein [Enhygromyxa salina]|nr:hypothetical protein [Enhygromyxa salina]